MHIKSLKLCFSHRKSLVFVFFLISYHHYHCYYYYQGVGEETISYHYKVSQTWDLANYLISWIITLTFHKTEMN